MGNFQLSTFDLNISSKGFRIDLPQIFNMNTDYISIKIVYDFRNVIFSKRDRRKTVICSFKRICRKFASIVDYSALFTKESVKDLIFLFEIFNVITLNSWKRYFSLSKKVFNIDH